MSYKVYASEAYVNEKEAKLNEEINKRPIVYSAVKSEIHKNMRFTSQEEFDAFLAETEHVSLGSEYVDENSWSKFYLVKIYDRFLEQEDFLKGSWHYSEGTSGCLIQELSPSYNQINHGYCVNVNNTNIIASLFENTQANEIFSGDIKDEDVLTPGVWAAMLFEYSWGEYRTIGIVETQFTATADPGVKMDPSLIDAEWMAKSSELNVTIDAGNVDQHDVSEDVKSIFFEGVLKISDYTLTPEELEQSVMSVHFDGGSETITGDMLQLEVAPNRPVVGDFRVYAENLYLYGGVNAAMFILAGENASITLKELDDSLSTTMSFPKGSFVLCEPDLIEMIKYGLVINLFTPSVSEAAPKLPEKYIPDAVVRAYRKEGYFPLDIFWDGVIGNKDNVIISEYNTRFGIVKISDCIPTVEELVQGTITSISHQNNSDLSFDETQWSLQDLIIETVPGGVVVYSESEVDWGSSVSTIRTPVVALVTNKELFSLTSISGKNELRAPSNGLYGIFLDTGDITAYVSKLYIPSCYQTVTKKIDPELIDAEWMAIETQSDLDITISNENADSFELVAGMLPKLSDYAPTIEQIKASTFTAVLLDGTVQEISITDGMIYHDDETMPSDMYIVNEFLLIIGSETTTEGITLSKGMYLGGPVSDILSEMQLAAGALHIPNAIRQANLLPEKFIPDTIPRAYAPIKGEFNWEFSGNVDDYTHFTNENGVSFVKITDIIFNEEERKRIQAVIHGSHAGGLGNVNGIPKEHETITLSEWSSSPESPGLFVVMPYGETGSIYILATKPSIVFDFSLTPGLWVTQNFNDDGTPYAIVESIKVSSAILDPGVKMDPSLIDAEWMAKKGSLEVEVNSENISNYLTDEISDLGAIFGFDAVLKLSDYFVSQDEFINGKCITEFGEVTGTDIPLIMGPGTADMGYTVTITNLWAYQLSDYVLLIADEGASVYVHDMNTTFSVPKGIYLGVNSEEELLTLGTLKFYCPEAADAIVPLPDKFLSDMVVQAGTKTGYFPLDISWDGEIGDREHIKLSTGSTEAYWVKVSDLHFLTKEQLLTSTITLNATATSDLVIDEVDYGYELCVPGQVEGNATSVAFVQVVHTPNDEFKSAGIYFVKTDLLNIGYVSNLHIQSYYQTITKKIDPELIDMDWYAGKRSGELDLIAPSKEDITDQETITGFNTDWGGGSTTSMTYVKVSDVTPTLEELRQGSLGTVVDGLTPIAEVLATDTNGYAYLKYDLINGTNAIIFGAIWPLILVLPEDATLDDEWDGQLHTKGTYLSVSTDSATHLYLPYVEDAAELVKLPEKYLPQETTNLNNLENGDTLVETIFNLFASGGGVTDMGMEYVNRIIGAFENKTFVEFTVSAVGYKIKCPLTCISDTDDGLLRQVSFTFLMDYSGVSRVTAFLLANTSSENLRVLVETFQ